MEYGPDMPPSDINVWHQDHTWRKRITRYELSYDDAAPDVGGDVIYADAVKADEALSPLLREMLRQTTAQNVFAQGYQNLKFGSQGYAQALLDRPPIEQPVVACDPLTGDKWLNVNRTYTYGIAELSKVESEAILPMLFAQTSKPEHCVRVQDN